MMESSKFSIVIPAYNQVYLINRVIDSILHQQEAEFEIIISDDSTTREIELYVKTLNDRRIKYFRHQQGCTAPDNWNNGLTKASGEYVIIQHHDEAMKDKKCLTRIQQAFDLGADLVISNIEVIVNGKKKNSHFNTWMKKLFISHPTLLFLFNAIGPCACIATKHTLIEPFNNKLNWFVDVEWYYRLISSNKRVIYLDENYMISIHGHDGQITSTMNVADTVKSDRAVLKQTYSHKRGIILMTFLYQHIIVGTKHILGLI